jgi:ferredoxin-fold anticodon binding domain-containing protein
MCLDFTLVVNSDAKSSLEVHIISLTKYYLIFKITFIDILHGEKKNDGTIEFIALRIKLITKQNFV